MKKNLGDLDVFLCSDYSGIEVRVLAVAGHDKRLIQQFNSGEDVHALVGQELTGIPAKTIHNDKQVRKKIKGFHFGLAYGLGPENGPLRLQAQGIKITRDEFAGYQRRYFDRYRGVHAYIQKCHHDVEAGYIETMFGFRRNISREDEKRGTYYKNQAVNTPIQQAAHQLVLCAVAVLHLKQRTYSLLSRPCMEVHDELAFFVRLRDVMEANKCIRGLMEEDVPKYVEKQLHVKFPVPLVAGVTAGFTRGTLVGYEDEDGNPLDIPSVDKFLEDWRAKHKKVSETPLEKLIPE